MRNWYHFGVPCHPTVCSVFLSLIFFPKPQTPQCFQILYCQQRSSSNAIPTTICLPRENNWTYNIPTHFDFVMNKTEIYEKKKFCILFLNPFLKGMLFSVPNITCITAILILLPWPRDVVQWSSSFLALLLY